MKIDRKRFDQFCVAFGKPAPDPMDHAMVRMVSRPVMLELVASLGLGCGEYVLDIQQPTKTKTHITLSSELLSVVAISGRNVFTWVPRVSPQIALTGPTTESGVESLFYSESLARKMIKTIEALFIQRAKELLTDENVLSVWRQYGTA